MSVAQQTRNINNKAFGIEPNPQGNKISLNKNLLVPNTKEAFNSRKLSTNSRGSIHAAPDGTFGLTGLEDVYSNSERKIKPNQSMHPFKDLNPTSKADAAHYRNRSFHDYSSFGISIDVIDKRYERWKTTRNKAIEVKQMEYHKMLSKIEKKNISREKSFAKFIRDRSTKQKDSLFKLTSRRETAKLIHENKIKETDEIGFERYKQDITQIPSQSVHTTNPYLAHENSRIDKEKMNTFYQQIDRDHNKSEEKLGAFNKRIKNAKERLEDQIRRRREALKTGNTHVADIKLKIDNQKAYESEQKMHTFYLKQLGHLKEAKKQEKKRREDQEKRLYKSMEKQNRVKLNQEANQNKWNDFTEKINDKYDRKLEHLRQTARIGDITNIEVDRNEKRRRAVKREQEKFKEAIMQRHLDEMRRKEQVKKRKEELVEFSLLKQKEIGREKY